MGFEDYNQVISDKDRRIRQLEEEQWMWSETAQFAEIARLQGLVDAYERRFSELKKLFNREVV